MEGAVANEEHLETIHEIRKRTKILISFGDCAVTGNVTAMRNLVRRRGRPEPRLSGNGDGDRRHTRPAMTSCRKLLARVRPVHEVVKVDYFLPGCPPSADAIYACLVDLLEGREPAGEVKRFG